MISQPTVYIIDDDAAVRDGLSLQLESAGLYVKSFDSSVAFLSSLPRPKSIACLILDVRMPEMTGPELQAELVHREINHPIIFLSGHGNIPLAVKSIQAGAIDFLTKPVDAQLLLDKVQEALALSASMQKQNSMYRASNEHLLETLTKREREILKLALEGRSNKEIARLLNISFRTVEHHRSHILLKTGVENLLKLSWMVKGYN